MSRAIVLASNNAGKLAELTQLLGNSALAIYPLSRFTKETAAETGTTFQENAFLKARFAASVSRLPAIADDSGLEVDALNGAPGVYSARYAGSGASDEANIDKLLAALTDVAGSQRTARFRCVLAYVDPEQAQPIFAEGSWEGRIVEAPRGSQGFGYDPIFLPRGSVRTVAEMGREEKNKLSHRAQALRVLAQRLPFVPLGHAQRRDQAS